MRNLVYFLVVFIILMGSGVYNKVKAQDPEFTQFYANPLYLNPAFAGSNVCPRVTMNYRNQWPSLSGNFVTTSTAYDQYFSSISGGIGITAVTDNAGDGTLKTTALSGIYSYKFNPSRKISVNVGFQASYVTKRLDWSKLTFGDMIDPRRGFIYETQDLPRSNLGVKNYADFSLGAIAYSKNFYGGAAVHHITEPNESLILDESKLPMKITLHAGSVIPINGKYGSRKSKASISPNAMFRTQAKFNQIMAGLYVNRGPLVGGLWLRSNVGVGEAPNTGLNGESFIMLMGIQTDYFKFGYSYDLTVSSLGTSTGGSHEISVLVSFECKRKRPRIRTINCPSF